MSAFRMETYNPEEPPNALGEDVSSAVYIASEGTGTHRFRIGVYTKKLG